MLGLITLSIELLSRAGDIDFWLLEVVTLRTVPTQVPCGFADSELQPRICRTDSLLKRGA
jgi:hypothetical protein